MLGVRQHQCHDVHRTERPFRLNITRHVADVRATRLESVRKISSGRRFFAEARSLRPHTAASEPSEREREDAARNEAGGRGNTRSSERTPPRHQLETFGSILRGMSYVGNGVARLAHDVGDRLQLGRSGVVTSFDAVVSSGVAMTASFVL